jgi:O-methyltransferase involved in polyketide biosynthesis
MLSGVPETALWTLYHRALAARKGVLEDPKAIALVDQIDHPFQERFGGGELAAWQACGCVPSTTRSPLRRRAPRRHRRRAR